MRIAFDLDGTICDDDWGWLEALKEKSYPEYETLKYYAARNLRLNPYNFASPGDELFIVTARPISLELVTHSWLNKNGLGMIPVIWLGKEYSPEGTPEEFKNHGSAKAAVLEKWEIEVYFDENESVIEELRNKVPPTIKIIHVGNHIWY